MRQLIFDQPADGWQQRWAIIRQFTEVWCGLSLAPSASAATRIADAEAMAGRPLSGSMRECIRFHSQLESSGNWEYGLKIKWLDGRSALSIDAIDADWYHAVRAEDLGIDDPPVQGYWRAGASEFDSAFRCWGRVGASITEFMLQSMLLPAQDSGGGGSVEVTVTEDWLAEMCAAFVVSQQFGTLRIFENVGQVVVVGRNPYLPYDENLTIGLWMSEDDPVPECIERVLSKGGGLNGRFAGA